MMPTVAGTHLASRPAPARLLSCIRFEEVCVLQGSPLIGAIFAMRAPRLDDVLVLAAIAAGNIFLVAHVFALNDWSGFHGDLRDPNRTERLFLTNSVSRAQLGWLSTLLLALSLLLFGLLGRTTIVLSLTIAGLSALYSAPVLHLKGVPLFNSLLHFVGGILHFLLGYAAFAPIDGRGLAIGCFFALGFTAGHLTNEVRDCEADLLNRIRTNAVAFGKEQAFFAGLILFTATYVLLVALAACAIVPRLLVLTGALYPLQLLASLRALRAGLNFESLRELQQSYRLLFGLVGIMMIITAVLA
jgi:4-hydroxybenzoate polyprenyltransferase